MTATLTIRADCSPQTGTGHVMRMIALGQAWQALGETVHFHGMLGPLNDRLLREGFQVTHVSRPHPMPDDLASLLDITVLGSLVALDGYHFDLPYQEALRSAGRKTLVLDDVCNRSSYSADILMNQNPDAAGYHYPINKDATLLLGSEYILLRNEFTGFPRRDEPGQGTTAKNVLVTLGGGDPDNITGKVIEALLRLTKPKLHVKIIVGPVNEHLPELERAARELPHTCEILHSVSDMPSLMDWADTAVSAAGSTCWELCYFNIPSLVILTADNQQGVFSELSRHEQAVCLDGSASVGDIAEKLHEIILNQPLRERLIRNGRALVDGKGARRVAAELRALQVTVRPVTQNDSETLLEWRNHPSVRKNYFNSDKVSPEQHESWFAGKLKDEDCLFLIAEDERENPLGQVRFDRQGAEAHVSVNVSPGMAGKGLGTTIMKKACRMLARHWPDTKAVALVKAENQASAIMFEKAQFTQTRTTETGPRRFEWIPGEHHD